MPESDARRFLAALAGDADARATSETPITDGSYRDRINAAIDATESLQAASTFLTNDDLDALEDAIERAEADLSGRAGEGRSALEALRRLQAAADGPSQFQSGRRSPLGSEDVADCR